MLDDIGVFGLVVGFELPDGHEDAFDALAAETVASIRASEPGTLVYVTHTERESVNGHEETGHVRRFLAERE